MADERFIQFIHAVSRGAQFSIKPLLVLLFGHLVIMLCGIIYLFGGWGLSAAWAFLPLYLSALPLLGLGFYWFSLDGIASLPSSLANSKETYAILQDRYAQRRHKTEIKGRGIVANTRRIFLLAGLVWDSRDVIDTASNVYGLLDLLNPIFWIFMLISVVSTVFLSGLYFVVSIAHYVFS